MIVYHLETPCHWLGWHDVFNQLSNHINNKYNATYHHKLPIIEKKGDHLYIDKFNLKQKDCELIIYDEKKDILKAITWCEVHSCGGNEKCLLDLFKERNNKNDILLITHQSTWFYELEEQKTYLKGNWNFTVESTPFYTFSSPIDHDIFYEKRKLIDYKDLNDQMFWLSTTRREDPFKLRELGLCNKKEKQLKIEEYLDLSINYKVGLSISSLAEICYRDIEYMATGIPMLRLEYKGEYTPPLIPNYHYIAIDRKKYNLPGSKNNKNWTTNDDRIGGDIYIQAYKERFLEVKDDYEFLNQISLNARKYYEDFCKPSNRVNHLLSRLKL